MNPFYRIIEILFLIVLPLLIIFLRSNWSNREIYFNVSILPLIWYLFYAPIHELGHILGCFIVGAEITDYRLFAHFWEGSFGFAFVDVKGGLGENISSFIILISPYIIDLISIIAGYYILTRYKIKNSFLFGLTFLIFSLRPLYDLFDNYLGYYYNHSDFVLASNIVGHFIIVAYVSISILISIMMIVTLIKKYKDHPELIT